MESLCFKRSLTYFGFLDISLTLVENPVRDAGANAIIDGCSGVAP